MRERSGSYRLYDESARKRPTNVSINGDLLKRARALGVNLSGTLEAALVEILGEARREGWVRENRDAIESYNQRVERAGVFGDGVRRF
jgi:antitoxin CcdA